MKWIVFRLLVPPKHITFAIKKTIINERNKRRFCSPSFIPSFNRLSITSHISHQVVTWFPLPNVLITNVWYAEISSFRMDSFPFYLLEKHNSIHVTQYSEHMFFFLKQLGILLCIVILRISQWERTNSKTFKLNFNNYLLINIFCTRAN